MVLVYPAALPMFKKVYLDLSKYQLLATGLRADSDILLSQVQRAITSSHKEQ